jgi:DNA-binding MarR family transcriptional regulator
MQVALRQGLSTFWPVAPAPAAEFRNSRGKGSLPTRGGSAEAKWVRDLLRARVARSEFFGDRLFADPAWDMLLELYAAELTQQRISISSLGSAPGIPLTTALRWINALEKDGLITRQADPLDGRRFFVALSQKGSQAIRDYFSSLPGSIYPFDD